MGKCLFPSPITRIIDHINCSIEHHMGDFGKIRKPTHFSLKHPETLLKPFFPLIHTSGPVGDGQLTDYLPEFFFSDMSITERLVHPPRIQVHRAEASTGTRSQPAYMPQKPNRGNHSSPMLVDLPFQRTHQKGDKKICSGFR